MLPECLIPPKQVNLTGRGTCIPNRQRRRSAPRWHASSAWTARPTSAGLLAKDRILAHPNPPTERAFQPGSAAARGGWNTGGAGTREDACELAARNATCASGCRSNDATDGDLLVPPYTGPESVAVLLVVRHGAVRCKFDSEAAGTVVEVSVGELRTLGPAHQGARQKSRRPNSTRVE